MKFRAFFDLIIFSIQSLNIKGEFGFIQIILRVACDMVRLEVKWVGIYLVLLQMQAFIHKVYLVSAAIHMV